MYLFMVSCQIFIFLFFVIKNIYCIYIFFFFSFLFTEPARFEFQSKNVTIRRGESVTLDCTVIGDNPIEVQWMHNSDRLDTNNHRLSISQIKTDNGLKSQLSIGSSDRQDSGVYRCTADNAYGRSEHLIYLAVQGTKFNI